MAEFTTALKSHELEPGQVRCVELAGKRIAISNVDGNFHATDDECPHAGASLSEGFVDGDALVCPLHAWRWDLGSGNACDMQGWSVGTYATRLEGDEIQVEV